MAGLALSLTVTSRRVCDCSSPEGDGDTAPVDGGARMVGIMMDNNDSALTTTAMTVMNDDGECGR